MPRPLLKHRKKDHGLASVIVLARISYVVATVTLCGNIAWADAPDTLWTRTYGGSNIDIGYGAQQSADSGFIVAGYTRSYGAAGHNLWLFKTDPAGTLQWSQAFGGNSDDEGHAVCQTSEGGYVVAGFTQSYGAGGKDVWLVKVSASGSEDWARTFGGSSDDEAYAVQETVDGALIIAGVTSSSGAGSRDMWLLKIDGSGDLLWSRTFGGSGSDGAWSVAQTSDEGFILAGWTYSYGPGYLGNAWLVKTDSLGTMEWQQSFGGPDADRGYAVQQTADDGYIMAGYTGSFGAGLYDLYLVKTNSDGAERWSRAFGGAGRDYANAVVETADGGYLAAGYTLSYGAGGDDVYVVRTDTDGNLEWITTYGGSASDVANALAKTSDGGYVVAGHTLSSGAGLHDAWVIRLLPEDPSAAPPLSMVPRLTVDVQPNPFGQTAIINYVVDGAPEIRVCIYDVSGRLVRIIQEGCSGSGVGAIAWDGLSQTGQRAVSGTYFCRLDAGGLYKLFKVVRVDY